MAKRGSTKQAAPSGRAKAKGKGPAAPAAPLKAKPKAKKAAPQQAAALVAADESDSVDGESDAEFHAHEAQFLLRRALPEKKTGKMAIEEHKRKMKEHRQAAESLRQMAVAKQKMELSDDDSDSDSDSGSDVDESDDDESDESDEEMPSFDMLTAQPKQPKKRRRHDDDDDNDDDDDDDEENNDRVEQMYAKRQRKGRETSMRKDDKDEEEDESMDAADRVLPVKDERGKVVKNADLVARRRVENEERERQRVSEEAARQAEARANAPDKMDDDQATAMDKDDSDESDEEEPRSAEDRRRVYLKKITRAKEELAGLASELMQNPEENLQALTALIERCAEDDALGTVRKYALLTALRVFVSLIPDYRIRGLTDVEKQQRMSKEVKQTVIFESTLLSLYHRFVLTLTRLSRLSKPTAANPHPVPPSDITFIAAKCLSELLATQFHFNYRTELITALLPLLLTPSQPKANGSSSSTDSDEDDADNDGGEGDSDTSALEQCRALAVSSVTRLFEGDTRGDASLEVVQAVSQAIKVRHFRVAPQAIDLFLRVRVDADLKSIRDINPVTNIKSAPSGDERMDRKAKTRENRLEAKKHVTKRQRKKNKVLKVLERDLRETHAEHSKAERQRYQTETLKMIFLTYFRVLKNTRRSVLLPRVLHGLGQLAHLINVDFFADMMNVFRSIVEDALAGPPGSPYARSIVVACAATAFRLLSGQGEILQIDLRDFYAALYSMVPDFGVLSTPARGSLDAEFGPFVDALMMMLKTRRQVSQERVFAYTKRLVGATLHAAPPVAMSLLAFVRVLFKRYSFIEQMLDSEDGGNAGATYQPEVDVPEHSHAGGALLWDLVALQQHVHPHVADVAGHLARGARSDERAAPKSALAAVTAVADKPARLLAAYDTAARPVLFRPLPAERPAISQRQLQQQRRQQSARPLEEGPLAHALERAAAFVTKSL